MPAVAVSVSVIASLTHTTPGPVMIPASGNGAIFTILLVALVPQLFEKKYVIVSIPADSPVIRPPDMDAVPLLVFHKPPATLSVNSVVAPPAHTVDRPVIASGSSGNGSIEMTFSDEVVPQLFVSA